MISREIFKERLEDIFNSHEGMKDICDTVKCLLLNDKDKIANYRLAWKKRQKVIDDYLKQYDEAETDQEKMAVIGSVKTEKFEATDQEIEEEKLKMAAEL